MFTVLVVVVNENEFRRSVFKLVIMADKSIEVEWVFTRYYTHFSAFLDIFHRSSIYLGFLVIVTLVMEIEFTTMQEC